MKGSDHGLMESRLVSSHTKVSFYIGILASVILLYIGIRHLNDPIEFDRNFGIKAALEGLFALIGLHAIDMVRGKKLSLYPKQFAPFRLNTLMRGMIIFACVGLIQILMQYVPLKIKAGEMALAIVFAAPAEEIFFRGVLISLAIQLGKILGKDRARHSGSRLSRMNPFVIAGIILSAMAFMSIHVNYYGYPTLMLTVFASGLVLGFFYWYWEDLTACIIAHFLINIILVYQTFWMVSV